MSVRNHSFLSIKSAMTTILTDHWETTHTLQIIKIIVLYQKTAHDYDFDKFQHDNSTLISSSIEQKS